MNPRPFSILIVSRDRSRLRTLSKFLDVFGYEVRQAIDAERAIIAAESSPPDFLVVDVTGGQPAELQLCRAIRKSGEKGYTYSLLLIERPSVGDITAALEAGFDDFLAAPLVCGELLARLRAGARYIEYERRLTDQTGTDSLTGLADRAALAAEIARSSGETRWLALFDIDYFQRCVDRLGKAATDEVVQQIAGLLRNQLDAKYLAAAFEADRLGVLLTGVNEDVAADWSEKLLQSLAAANFTAAGQSLRFTASCGLAEVKNGETLEAVFARGQRALQLAKASGRDCVVTGGEVEEEAEAWAALAADGKLFQTTIARDVMHPCPLLLNADERVEQAHSLLAQTGLTQAPVVDTDQKLVGLVSLDKLRGNNARGAKSRSASSIGSSSVRLVRHVMTTDVTRFDEHAPLAELMEFFTRETDSLAVIVRDRQPRGVVHCQALAALNERLTIDHFATTRARTGTSADLLVPDLALAE